ncbi:hypothetical protein [Herbaspirillum robiniae]|uniref:hypothetical protein n=1 Tax=Herbaspirillum robiniae TaxID=2014887 RepID=UPI003D77AE5C
MNNELTNIWKWQAGMAAHLRFPFENAARIPHNHSQAWQDLFVISMLEGRRGGRYLEVGANVASFHNNTCLLNKQFDWQGISLEYDPACLQSWIEERPEADFVIADALGLNYAEALPRWFGEENKRIDYLQLDIDPSFNTLQVLRRLPLDTYRFSVITFETDSYSGDQRARDESREILRHHGYQLVAPDLCVMYEVVSPNPIPFEDWWVDPQAVDPRKIAELQQLPHAPLLPQHILFRD